jgi:hypothetical protein
MSRSEGKASKGKRKAKMAKDKKLRHVCLNHETTVNNETIPTMRNYKYTIGMSYIEYESLLVVDFGSASSARPFPSISR